MERYGVCPALEGFVHVISGQKWEVFSNKFFCKEIFWFAAV